MVYSKADWECESSYDQIMDPNGTDLIALKNPKGDAMIILERGHVTSWRNNRGDELLYTSKKQSAVKKEQKVMR
ncbi:hypothetical protein AgCh_021092 [Apium graveolens]